MPAALKGAAGFFHRGLVYQLRLTPVSMVPNTSTPLALPELLEELGMVPEQALSAIAATVAARVSHLRIVHLLARKQRGPCFMVALGGCPLVSGGYA